MSNLPPDRMQTYIATAQKRQQLEVEALHDRRQQAIAVADQAAEILKAEFSVEKVVLFGSLLTENFHATSDIDLAVWGLPEAQYFQAVSRLLSLSEYEFDLVEIQFASAYLLDAIAKGQVL